jgi:hypothetical protein
VLGWIFAVLMPFLMSFQDTLAALGIATWIVV